MREQREVRMGPIQEAQFESCIVIDAGVRRFRYVSLGAWTPNSTPPRTLRNIDIGTGGGGRVWLSLYDSAMKGHYVPCHRHRWLVRTYRDCGVVLRIVSEQVCDAARSRSFSLLATLMIQPAQ